MLTAAAPTHVGRPRARSASSQAAGARVSPARRRRVSPIWTTPAAPCRAIRQFARMRSCCETRLRQSARRAGPSRAQHGALEHRACAAPRPSRRRRAEYAVCFTANATAAVKLVAESYPSSAIGACALSPTTTTPSTASANSPGAPAPPCVPSARRRAATDECRRTALSERVGRGARACSRFPPSRTSPAFAIPLAHRRRRRSWDSTCCSTRRRTSRPPG